MVKARYIEKDIQNICFAAFKMAFVSGPRQCGKTTLSKHMLKLRGLGEYYNWDDLEFRKQWTQNPKSILPHFSDSKKPLVILDELHKAKLWKRNLKGVYDTLETPCDLLVTGSARLNTYRKGSDSLLGRYYLFRLHPFSLHELLARRFLEPTDQWIEDLFSKRLKITSNQSEAFHLLDKFGPFPEPLFSASERTLNLWRKGRIEKLIREDLRDLTRLPELSQIEMLVSLLPERASNILSLRSLGEDLEVAYTTVQRWLMYLKELYYCFSLSPYFKSLARSIKKEKKLYLWDWSEVEDEGGRFENLIASHLLKYCHYLTDAGYGNYELAYLRNKFKKEIDFLILKNKKPWLPIEAKLSQQSVSENWKAFLPALSCVRGVQVIKEPCEMHKVITTEYGEILILSADVFLSYLV